MSLFISFKRAANTFALDLPMVESKAGNCLFLLVSSKTSPSTSVIFPTPALAINSAA